MIKRILNPDEFKILIDDMSDLYDFENENQGHFFLKHNKDSIKNNYGNKFILAWEFFVWANHDGHKFDSMIAFVNDKNAKFEEKIFSEFLWLSKNPKAGYKLFKKALDFARDKEFTYITMSSVCKHPNSYQVKRFYEKMGFIKDTEIFIAKL